MKATIIGAGNIGMALATGLVESGTCTRQEITLTRKNPKSLEAPGLEGFQTTTSNIAAVAEADTIFICVLPQQLNELLEELKDSIDCSKQLVVSVDRKSVV